MKRAVGFALFAQALICISSIAPVQAQGISPKEFDAVLSENIQWKSFPAFPETVRLAIVVGDPQKPAPFVVRVKVPADAKIMPHSHPEDRIYTVISGVFYIGIGDKYDPAALKAYAPGSVIVLPGNTPHFHWAKSGEYVSQVSAIGPLGLHYIDPANDPRKK
ncbi:cupin domain-containing protein [Bradyrhizobium sp. AUGA SZCCT0176]|uniref:cupin domain-containing protein n=1 Tax=Bradyrhizobium sp. AUGA SZCCT0176 TaxID=2807664 RepID=UPI002011711B|nr:cupin domain-containing protein [Bradyrhizobium sp. AUGA SZCCT0176]